MLTELDDPETKGVGLVVDRGVVSGEYASLGVVNKPRL